MRIVSILSPQQLGGRRSEIIFDIFGMFINVDKMVSQGVTNLTSTVIRYGP